VYSVKTVAFVFYTYLPTLSYDVSFSSFLTCLFCASFSAC